MEKVESYNLLCSDTITEIDSLVNHYLELGFRLYGEPFVDKEGRYCQAVVK